MIHIAGVVFQSRFPRHSRSLHRSSPLLQDIQQLELHIVDIAEPLVGEQLREETSVPTSLRQIVDHMLNEGALEHGIVLVRRTLIHILVLLRSVGEVVETAVFFCGFFSRKS
jgi:hypothetical protein